MLCAILLPFCGAALCAIRADRLRRALTAACLCGSALLSVLAALFGVSEESWTLLPIAPTLSLALHCDRLSAYFGLMVAPAWLAVGLYAFRYIQHEGGERRFYCCMLIVEGAFFALLYAANLVTMYVFFEMITLTSMPLVLHSGSKESIAAAQKYLFYSIAGAFFALFGIFVLANLTTTLDFAPGGHLSLARSAERQELLRWGVFLAMAGFGVKAGLYPMHGWLPTAHPVAPAPASALLSGVITGAGVFSILRTLYYVAGPESIRGSWAQYLLLGMALFTVFLGSMMAYREPVLKKRLAYSTVSQVSYALYGFFLLQSTAVAGGLLQVMFHAYTKIALFLCAGSIIYKTEKTRVEELRGIGKEMPVTLWAFALASLSLIGIPPASGFVSKWYLATGSLTAIDGVYGWLGPVVLLVSALLTAGYLLPVVIRGFFPGKDYDYSTPKTEAPASMWAPTLACAAAAVLMGVFSGPIVSFCRDLGRLLLEVVG